MADRPPITNPDSAHTRERLLDAAERLFAQRGFRSASVRDITRESSCNIAAVNYHFGGKSNLYREVFLRRLRAIRKQRLDSIEAALSSAGEEATLELVLQAFTSAFVAPLVEDPSGRLWVLLLAQEMIDPQLPSPTFRAEMIEPVEAAVVEALARVCPQLSRPDAQLSVQSLVGQLVHVVKLQQFMPVSDSRWELPELVAHTVRFTVAGIRALARDPVAAA
ncbi:MAG TPA: CerR family C-terminal domain-containing protein [Thermoanaerobaculia bacterium]|jgi:AcrR family transcriptional regulator|nr:CerR family C-terminal domain-containing protein [Thermoanaerobaculia bacterium]